MVALPGQLFYNTAIPACLWFVTKDKSDHGKRKRTNEILFIDARNMGKMIDNQKRQEQHSVLSQTLSQFANRATIIIENYQGVPTGIDIRLVVETGIVPTINTGIAHREPGIGQVGAGVVKAPMACFEKALRALGERLGIS